MERCFAAVVPARDRPAVLNCKHHNHSVQPIAGQKPVERARSESAHALPVVVAPAVAEKIAEVGGAACIAAAEPEVAGIAAEPEAAADKAAGMVARVADIAAVEPETAEADDIAAAGKECIAAVKAAGAVIVIESAYAVASLRFPADIFLFRDPNRFYRRLRMSEERNRNRLRFAYRIPDSASGSVQ